MHEGQHFCSVLHLHISIFCSLFIFARRIYTCLFLCFTFASASASQHLRQRISYLFLRGSRSRQAQELSLPFAPFLSVLECCMLQTTLCSCQRRQDSMALITCRDTGVQMGQRGRVCSPVVPEELGGGRGDWGGNEVTSSGPLQRLLFPAAGSRGAQCSSATGARRRCTSRVL